MVWRAVDEQLATWGKVVLLRTRGRVSGAPAVAAVGFIEEPDGTLLVAAGGPDVQWARNLAADPRCHATRAGETREYVAEEIHSDRRNAAIAGLILKYGTPAEGLGSGPAFALRPVPHPPRGVEAAPDVEGGARRPRAG